MAEGEYEVLKRLVEEELYAALDALEREDLITARQQASRAASDICEAWRALRGSFLKDGVDIYNVINE